MEPQRGRTLPDFDDPPAVETVLGVAFEPLASWGVPHFGLYWNGVRGEYPEFQVQPAILGEVPFDAGLGLVTASAPSLGALPPERCWFFTQDRTRLIQLQSDRFLQNWIKVGPQAKYLHYEALRPAFLNEWRRFNEFLTLNGIGTPRMLSAEVTYVNHLDQGRGWKDFSELPLAVAPWSGKGSSGFLGSPDAVGLSVRYPIPDRGYLVVVAGPAVRKSDGQATLQLRLTARVQIASTEPEAVAEAIDWGRNFVVNGFADFTTKHMHEVWGRTV